MIPRAFLKRKRPPREQNCANLGQSVFRLKSQQEHQKEGEKRVSERRKCKKTPITSASAQFAPWKGNPEKGQRGHPLNGWGERKRKTVGGKSKFTLKTRPVGV